MTTSPDPFDPEQPTPVAPAVPSPKPPLMVSRAQSGRETELEKYLQTEGWSIEIVDAHKTTEGGSSYIVYVIKAGPATSYRRYSEFASFRNSLASLYPTLIVPPIPPKSTVVDYAVKQNKAKEDAAMISKRKRMLEDFLRRIGAHPILGMDKVFLRFLDGGVSWTEILHSPPLSLLPKNPLKAPAHDPTSGTNFEAYAALPNPSAAQPLRNPDTRFLESEAFTNKFVTHLSGGLEKVNRRVMKRWGEHSHDYAELGAVLNGFSVTETGSLSNAIEKTGQAVDATYMSTAQLLQSWETEWTEPLNTYTQFGSTIKKLLAYRHQKNLQYEMTVDSIDSKKVYLEGLEKSEAEAKRVEDALRAAGVPVSPPKVSSSTQPSTSAVSSGNGDEAGSHGSGSSFEEVDSSTIPSSASAQQDSITSRITAKPSSSSLSGVSSLRAGRSSGSSYGFLSALSHSLTGMMDVDPEATRRNNISKTKDQISQLEDALHLSAQDLKYASETIQADLDRFQRQKVVDIRAMSIALATMHRDWCKQNLEAWKEAKRAIDAIEPHPATPPAPPPPPSQQRQQSSHISSSTAPPVVTPTIPENLQQSSPPPPPQKGKDPLGYEA